MNHPLNPKGWHFHASRCTDGIRRETWKRFIALETYRETGKLQMELVEISFSDDWFRQEGATVDLWRMCDAASNAKGMTNGC